MISDTLSEALAQIEEYEKDKPTAYGGAEVKAKIAAVKEAMRGLQRELDSGRVAPNVIALPKPKTPKKENDWCGLVMTSNQHAVLCPICKDGDVFGDTGESNSHLIGGWIDSLGVMRAETMHGGFRTIPSPPRTGGERGSEVGYVCSFEQCEHIVEYRLRFHKGDTYVEWRESIRKDWPGMPRD